MPGLAGPLFSVACRKGGIPFWGLMAPSSGFTPWPTRIAPSRPPSSNQLFPLPPPYFDPGGGGSAKRAGVRARCRERVWDKSREITSAANALFGGGMEFSGKRSDAQQSAMSHIFRCAKQFFDTGPVQTPREYREILGSRVGYGEQASAVEPYDPSRVSLPSGRLRPVPMRRS